METPGVWLMHWTGRVIIACAGHVAYQFSLPGGNPLALVVDRAWLIGSSGLTPMPLDLLVEEDRDSVRRQTGSAANRVGIRTGTRIISLPTFTFGYDPDEYRRQTDWPVTILRDQLQVESPHDSLA